MAGLTSGGREERNQTRPKKTLRQRFNKMTDDPPKFQEEELRFFSGVDNEPFTPELEAELIETKGWSAADIAELRAGGAQYNRHRNSAVFPLQHEGPMFEKSLPARAKVAVGRNDPCPCGSGKKFKKCCGATP